jgi:hypothetical protein
MKVPTRTLAALAVAVLSTGACLLTPLSPAQALPGKTGSTTTTRVFDHDTATYPVGAPFCDFPIERTYDGLFHARTTTYADGSVLVHEWVSGLTYTLTNPANGKTLSSALGGTEDLAFAPDGTLVEDEIKGNNINFTAPEVGRVTGYVGRIRQVTLPDGTTTIDVQTHNEADSVFTAACAYLS